MLVDGLQVERKTVTVNVSPEAVVNKLFDYWKASIGRSDQDIANGEWERSTEVEFYSGLTTKYGKATSEQAVVYDSFMLMFTIAKEYEKKHS